MQKRYKKEDMPIEIYHLLEEIWDWCDQRADADGDSEGFHANDEMKLQMEIDGLIDFNNKSQWIQEY